MSQFFKDWPELMKNPLFVTGHDYGGIFVPYLTWQLHQHNEFIKTRDPLNTKDLFNLKGYIIANGFTDFSYDGFVRTAPEMFNTFNLVPRRLFDWAKEKNC